MAFCIVDRLVMSISAFEISLSPIMRNDSKEGSNMFKTTLDFPSGSAVIFVMGSGEAETGPELGITCKKVESFVSGHGATVVYRFPASILCSEI